jgi:hypothetical protein
MKFIILCAFVSGCIIVPGPANPDNKCRERCEHFSSEGECPKDTTVVVCWNVCSNETDTNPVVFCSYSYIIK